MKRLPLVAGLFLWTSSLLPMQAWAADAAQAARYYEDALARFEKKDDAGAIIQLKNALQQDPNYLSAYLLLGQAQLRSGDPAGAELSFATASRMGADRTELADALAEAFMLQGKFRELIDQLRPERLPASVAFQVRLKRAYAYMALNDLESAEKEIKQATEISPTSGEVDIAQGMLNLQKGDLTAAQQYATQAIKNAKDDPRSWNLKASIAHITGDVNTALSGYDRALSLQERFTDVRVARAGLLFDLNRMEDAFKDLSYLKTHNPQEPRGAYLRSVYYARKGDNAAAKTELLLAVKGVDSLPPAYRASKPQLLMVGALANHALHADEQAKTYADAYVRLKPQDVGARKLLATIQLAQDETEAAISNLLQASRLAPNDPNVLQMLASAYIARNQYAKAANLLEQAGPMVLQKSQLSSALGYSLIGLGREAQGMEYLTQAFAKNPANFRLGSSLVMFHIQRGEPRSAIQVAETVLAKLGKSPATFNLLGVAKAAAQDAKGARAAYTKALEKDPRFNTARLNLAKLETAQGNLDAARQQLQTILKSDGKNVQAQYELGLTELVAGHDTEALRWLQSAHTLSPRNSIIAVKLINTFLALGETDKALALAKQTAAAAPDDFDVASALGRSHAAAGQTSRAQTTFASMSKIAGFDVNRLEEVARLQLAIGDRAGASFSLNKALGEDASAIEANLLMAQMEIREGKQNAALDRAKRVAAANPRSARAQSGLGDILLAARQPEQAAQAFRAAQALDNGPDNALRYQQALRASGREQEALRYLEERHQKHPDEAGVSLALAEVELQLGKSDSARDTYEQHLKRFGDNPMVLNNLANIYMQQGNLAKAVGFAERAYKLVPDAAPVNDTLGWLVLQQGDTDRALRHLREARARAPGDPAIHFHLATALHKSGRTSEARRELELALKGNANFAEINAAKQLQRELTGQ